MINLKNNYIDMMGFLISREKVISRATIFRRFRRSVARIKKHGAYLDAARSALSRYGWIKNAQCRHYMKRNRVQNIIAICKEMISDGKDVVYQAAA